MQQQDPSCQPSRLVAGLSASATLAMSQKSQELAARGVDVINMSVGQPDFPTPEFVKQAAVAAIRDNYTYYTPVAGFPELRRAIVGALKRDKDMDFTPEQIVVSNGAKQALANVILSTVNPGDEVIIPTPAWVSYSEQVRMASGTVVPLPTAIDSDFKVTPAQLEAAMTERTRMLILCSPCNPTGTVYSRSELQELARVLLRHPRVLVMADEIYEHIVFSGKFTSLGSFPELAGRVVIINGVSKTYSMTGWRIGFCAAPLWLARACAKLQSQYTSNACSIAQKAAQAAYEGPQDCVAARCEVFRRRRDLITSLARKVPGWKVNEPQGAFYLFPQVSDAFGKTTPGGQVIHGSDDLAMYLLQHAHVATVSGAAFGSEGYIRLSYATSDQNITQAMARITQAIQELK